MGWGGNWGVLRTYRGQGSSVEPVALVVASPRSALTKATGWPLSHWGGGANSGGGNPTCFLNKLIFIPLCFAAPPPPLDLRSRVFRIGLLQTFNLNL